MNIEVDWDRVLEVSAHHEDNDIWTICFVFDNYQVCTYGYSDHKDFIKDYTALMNRERSK